MTDSVCLIESNRFTIYHDGFPNKNYFMIVYARKSGLFAYKNGLRQATG